MVFMAIKYCKQFDAVLVGGSLFSDGHPHKWKDVKYKKDNHKLWVRKIIIVDEKTTCLDHLYQTLGIKYVACAHTSS